jgi:2-keto-4-pentenoate hydratase/2-oxohepta-3-ene-1,7-dioic acid hydratase in catechol pathway
MTMKLATFTHAGRTRIGVVDEGDIVDLAAAVPDLPQEMCAFLRAGRPALDSARNALLQRSTRLRVSDVWLEAPVQRPGKLITIGVNYREHAAEAGRETPQHPPLNFRLGTCINAPYGDMWLPSKSVQFDYELEFSAVIGRRCRGITREQASQVVVGYTIFNDGSVRDYQLQVQRNLGKSWDTHGPLGPWIVTADEIADPHNLEFRTTVNGEVRQHDNTGNMIHDWETMIEYASTAWTLEPGDVIATGTCGGVAFGMQPPQWLKVGDVVRMEVEGIGYLENRVVPEPPGTMGFIG